MKNQQVWYLIIINVESINVRAAFIHVLGDLLQSIGVIIAAIFIKINPEWKLIDPICTFVFSVIIMFTTFGIVRDCLKVLMEGVPIGINTKKMEEDLRKVMIKTKLQVKGVTEVHDLHVWALNMGRASMSCHLKSVDPMVSLKKATRLMNIKYKILQTTIQVEKVGEDKEEMERHRFTCETDF